MHFLQSRFVRILYDTENQGHFLEYYKYETDASRSGVLSAHDEERLNLDTVEWTRPYDTSADCRRFEIFANNRVYLFEANSHAEMQVWLASIEMVREERKRSVATEVPLNIQIFDGQGEAAYVSLISREINERVYPANDLYEVPITEHIERVKKLSRYLHNEIEVKILKTKRYDILLVSVNTVLKVFSDRISPVLRDSSMQLLSASLGDLHALITCLASLQNQVNNIYYGPEGHRHSNCRVFDRLPDICDRYVNGSHIAKKGSPEYFEGAVHHLIANCTKIADDFLSKPGESVQKHENGSFYTNAPVELWTLLNQHLQLAAETECPILQVMIANKVCSAMNRAVASVSDFISRLDSAASDVRKVELELLAALANDNAMHIEEICVLISSFKNEDIRNKIDSIYERVIVDLVGCGQKCLKRLVSTVLADITTSINLVFTEPWLESNPIKVAVATLKDYFDDFDTFLLPFWLDKFVVQMLEAVVVQYSKSVLFRGKIEPLSNVPGLSNNLSKSQVSSVLMSFSKMLYGSQTEQMTAATDTSAQLALKAEPESLGRLAQDVNLFNAFFIQKAGAEKAEEVLVILNEILLFLQLPLESICYQVKLRFGEFPSAAQAIFETAAACIRLREDLPPAAICTYEELCLPAMQMAQPESGQFGPGVKYEGNLGHMYSSLWALAISKHIQTESTQRLDQVTQMMYVPLATLKTVVAETVAAEEEDPSSSTPARTPSTQYTEDTSLLDGEYYSPASSPSRGRAGTGRRQSGLHNSRKLRRFSAMLAGKEDQDRLVEQVLDIVNSQTAENIRNQTLLQRQQEEREDEAKRLKESVIFLESYLDKRSPQNNAFIWQKRWYRLYSRPKETTEDGESPFTYTLTWSKKQHGSVIKSIDVSRIESISLVEIHRDLVFNESKGVLMLLSQALKDCKEDTWFNIQVKDTAAAASNMDMVRDAMIDSLTMNNIKSIKTGECYVFCLRMSQSTSIQPAAASSVSPRGGSDVKDVYNLRTTNVDKLVRWVNCLAQASGMVYDRELREWTRENKRSSSSRSRLSAARKSFSSAFGESAFVDNEIDDDDDDDEHDETEAAKNVKTSPPTKLTVPSFLGLTRAELEKRSNSNNNNNQSDGGTKTPRSARSVDKLDLDQMVDEQLSEADYEDDDDEDAFDEGRSRSGSAATAVSDTERRRPSLINFLSSHSFRTKTSARGNSKSVSFHDDANETTYERESLHASQDSTAQDNLRSSSGSAGRSRILHVSKLTSALLSSKGSFFSSKSQDGSPDRSESQKAFSRNGTGYVSASALAEKAAESSKSLQSEFSRPSHSEGTAPYCETRSYRSDSFSSSHKVLYRPEMIEGWLVKRSKSITGFGYKWKRRYCRINVKMCSLVTSTSER